MEESQGLTRLVLNIGLRKDTIECRPEALYIYAKCYIVPKVGGILSN